MVLFPRFFLDLEDIESTRCDQKVLGPMCFRLPGNESVVITFQYNPPSSQCTKCISVQAYLSPPNRSLFPGPPSTRLEVFYSCRTMRLLTRRKLPWLLRLNADSKSFLSPLSPPPPPNIVLIIMALLTSIWSQNWNPFFVDKIWKQWRRHRGSEGVFGGPGKKGLLFGGDKQAWIEMDLVHCLERGLYWKVMTTFSFPGNRKYLGPRTFWSHLVLSISSKSWKI